MAQSGDGLVVPAVDQTLPSLPKIKTKPPVEDGELLFSEREEAAGCVTPTSEEHRIKPATECPLPPQKPPVVATIKRKKADEVLRVRRRQLVPRNLSVVFAILPPKKRLRAEPDQFF